MIVVTVENHHKVVHKCTEVFDMSLQNFGVVMVGSNFPVSSIRISDFTFRHRALNETMRLPIAVQAENEIVSLVIVADRFQVIVKTPDDIAIQSAGLRELVDTFLEYAGRRTITSIGHNMIWTLPGSATHKADLVAEFVKADSIHQVLGVSRTSADLTLNFPFAGGTARLSIVTSLDGDAILDFNFNHDLSAGGNPVEVVATLERTVALATEIAERAELVVSNVTA